MKKTLLTLVLTMAAIAGAMAQSITNATFSYTFNGEGRRMSCPASGLDVVDLTGTVAENLQINAVTVQTSGSVSSVTMKFRWWHKSRSRAMSTFGGIFRQSRLRGWTAAT